MDATIVGISYRERIERLRAAKLEQTAEKREVVGTMDHDDWGMVLPPEERRALTRLIGSSGAPITDVKLSGIDLESNHPSGGFFGPAICGRNFRTLLELHPVYIDPVSSLAGGYMTNFFSYRSPHWNPDLDTSEFSEDRERYQLMMGIGGAQHFCQDLTIGLESGWGGLLGKIERYEGVNGPDSRGFYEGLRHVIHGARNWITRHAERAAELAGYEADELLAANLRSMAEVNRRIVDAPPRTFLEACQWTLWYQMLARMYNGSGSLGAMDQVLLPFYERDTAAGILTDDEAVFHIACLLLRDTAYVQLGGYDADGRDSTNRLSYLVLEAAELLRIPANLGVAVGPGIDPGLLRRGVEMQFRHRNGIPKFLGVANTARDFAKNGYDIALGYNRIYSGCHWSAIPGREYTMNDIIKINLARVFEVAFDDMYELGHTPSVTLLRTLFEDHLRRAVGTIARGIDFHMRRMHEVFPELVLDLLCHGPIERGRDASDGGLDFYDIGIDAAGLSIVADSFAALERRIEEEEAFGWEEVRRYLASDWAGAEGERARLMMKSVPKYGHGGTSGDEWAVEVSRLFTRTVTERATPGGFRMIPGLFSWALAPALGRQVGATPDGRHSGAPLAHGSNPSPGFRKDGAATALAAAVASVQPGFGQTAPLQLDVDPGMANERDGIEFIEAVINGHFDLGGTQINLNVMDTERILAAYEDPSLYPDLIVRVTGFSAYFANLSDDLRKLVVDRIVREHAPG